MKKLFLLVSLLGLAISFMLGQGSQFDWMNKVSTTYTMEIGDHVSDEQGNVYCMINYSDSLLIETSSSPVVLKTDTSNRGLPLRGGAILAYSNEGDFLYSVNLRSTSYRTNLNQILVDSDGSIFLTGFAAGPVFSIETGSDTFIFDKPALGDYTLIYFCAKIKANGEVAWLTPLWDPASNTSFSREDMPYLVLRNGILAAYGGFYFLNADIDPGPGVARTCGPPLTLFVASYDLETGAFLSLKTDCNSSDGVGSHISHMGWDGFLYQVGVFAQGTSDLDPGPGSYSVTSEYGTGLFIRKLDSIGNFVRGSFIKTIDLALYVSPEPVQVELDALGRLQVLGEFTHPLGNGTIDRGEWFLPVGATDAFLLTFDADFVMENIQLFGSIGAEQAHFLTTDQHGGTAVGFSSAGEITAKLNYLGETKKFKQSPSGSSLGRVSDEDLFVVKFGPDMSFEWMHQLGIENFFQYRSLNSSIKGDFSNNGELSIAAYHNYDGAYTFDPFGQAIQATDDKNRLGVIYQMQTFSVGLDGALTKTTASLFPNPVSDKLYLSLPDVRGPISIEIFDPAGKELIKVNTQSQTSWETPLSLPAGTYYLHIGYPDQSRETIPFTIQ